MSVWSRFGLVFLIGTPRGAFILGVALLAWLAPSLQATQVTPIEGAWTCAKDPTGAVKPESIYVGSYDYDPGEPMVPSSETYTLSRLTPVLARAQLQGVPERARVAAQPLLEVLAQGWEPMHAALAGAVDGGATRLAPPSSTSSNP